MLDLTWRWRSGKLQGSEVWAVGALTNGPLSPQPLPEMGISR